MGDNQLVRDLCELVAALDRRVPRVAQAGEASIARDAATLREKAMKRLAEIGAVETCGLTAPRTAAERAVESSLPVRNE